MIITNRLIIKSMLMKKNLLLVVGLFTMNLTFAQRLLDIQLEMISPTDVVTLAPPGQVNIEMMLVNVGENPILDSDTILFRLTQDNNEILVVQPPLSMYTNAAFFITGTTIEPGDTLLFNKQWMFGNNLGFHEFCFIASIVHEQNPLTEEVLYNNSTCLHYEMIENLEIKEVSSFKLEVGPNPTSGIINFSQISSLESWNFYSLDGKEMGGIIANPTGWDICALPAGVYLLQVTKEGSLWKQKVVKH